jgi:hypothetical protein
VGPGRVSELQKMWYFDFFIRRSLGKQRRN